MKKVNDFFFSIAGSHRWKICLLLFFATTINYLDRQLFSLLAPALRTEFNWTDLDIRWFPIAFTLFYGVFMLIGGRFIDRIGTKKGLLWSLIVWSIFSMAHAFAPQIGIAINPIVSLTGLTISTCVLGFIVVRALLGIGQAGIFPAAIKATAEWFPKKERSLCTGLFNSGTNIGAILAPLSVPPLVIILGWQWTFIVLGGVTLVWVFFWIRGYDTPTNMLKKGKLSQKEYDYIHSDDQTDVAVETITKEEKTPWHKVLKYPQTWAFAVGKFMTDGIWWFFLFWLPLYLYDQFDLSGMQIMLPLAVLYLMATVASIYGGFLPARLMNRGLNPYKARMTAMFIIALFPLAVLGAQPLGVTVWIPVILIGIGASAHQAWSANLFTTVSDMFPKKAVGSVVGIGGLAGCLGSIFVHYIAGLIFHYHRELGQIEVGYTIMFVVCALAYLVAWTIMKILVPRYKVIKEI